MIARSRADSILARLRRAPTDGGFTLVEVMVSLMLVALIMGSLAYMFVHTVRASNVNAQRTAAVMIADQQLEFVRSIKSDGTSDCVGTGAVHCDGELVAKRAKADVDALEAAPRSSAVDMTGTNEAYDAGVSSSLNATVPLTKTETVDNAAYLIRYFIRVCARTATGCDLTPGTPTTYNQMYRVWVAVSWAPQSTDQCSGYTATGGQKRCEYVSSTLIDGHLNADGLFH